MFSWGLNNSINGLLDSLTAPLQDWLSQHPLLQWFVSHPLWLLIAMLAALFLLSGLLRAIAGLTEKLWLALLRLPFILFQTVWRSSLFLLLRPFEKPTVASLTASPAPDRLTEILNRLEALRQEQDELLQEVRSLLLTDQKNR